MANSRKEDISSIRKRLAETGTSRKYRASEEDLKNFYGTVENNINTWFELSNEYFNSANDFYKGFDDSDYTLGKSMSTEWKTTATNKNAWLKQEYENINKILNEYGRYFDSDWISQVRSSMGEVLKASDDIYSQANKSVEYWDSWDDIAKEYGTTAEEAYKNSYYSNKYNGYSYADIQKAIEEATKEDEKNWLTSNADSYMTSAEAQKELDMYSNLLDKGAHITYTPNGLDTKATNEKSKDFKDKIAYYTTLANKALRREQLAEMLANADADPEFDNYVKQGESKGLAMENEWFKWDTSGILPAVTVFDRGYSDEIIASKNGKAVGTSNADIQKYVNYMDDDQYNYYAYLLGKHGKETAQEYLELIEEEINTGKAKDIRKGLDNAWARHLQLPQLLSIYTGLDQFSTGLESLFSDGYKAPSEFQIATNLVKEDQNAGGKMAMDLGQSIGNMLPSILASAVSNYIVPGSGVYVGATLMGTSAGGNAYQEMLNLGYNKDQAAAYGVLTGVSEACLQYALGGIDSLGGGFTSKAVSKLASGVNKAGAKWAIQFGAEMASEGLEEGLQEILTPVFKTLTTGQKFEGVDLEQVAYSAFLGALSAGVLNGVGAVGTRANELSIAKGIKGNEGKINTLKEIASKQSVSNLAMELSKKIDTKTGAWKIADLIHEMHGTLSEQNVADIKYQLQRNGVMPTDADSIAKYLAKAVDGENLTALQRKALDTNPIIQRVFKKVVLDQNSTVNQRLNALMEMEGKVGHAGVDYSAIAKSQSKEALSASATLNQYMKGAETDAIKAKYNLGRSGMLDTQINDTINGLVNKVKDTVSKAKVSESGATSNATTGKKISINMVTETDGKTATFALADGTTISNKDVEYADSDEGLLYEGAISLGYDANITNAIIQGKKGVDLPVGKYLNGIDEAIEYGRIGYPMDKISTEGFFAELPKSMQNYAYNLGKESAKADVEKAQAKVDANKGKVTETKKGEVVKLYEKSGLTPRQEASLDTLGKVVSDITNNKVYIFDTVEKTINGKKVRVFAQDTAEFKAGTIAPNGFINKATGEIYIDLHAGDNAEGVILWTLAHELTHFVRQWSPARFNVLADFLMAEYGKQGVDVRKLIDQKIANSKMKNLSRDEAYEEVVADAMQTMFTDTDLASKLERLKTKDRGLWNKIKQFFADLYKRVKGEYKDVDAQTEEAKKVRKMSLETIGRLSDLFAEAVVDAGNTYANVDIKAVTGEVDIDGNESSHTMSIRSMVEGAGLSFEFNEKTGEMKVRDMYKGTEVSSVTKEQIKDAPLGNIVSIAKENGFITDAEANKQYGFLADLVNLCLNYKENFTMVWEIAGTQVFSAIKANSDTQYGKTIDFSTVCKKTQQVINVISETQKRLKRGLTKEEIKDIVYYETGKAKEPTPCPVCYVFSRWMGIGGILQQMSDFQKKYEGVSEAEMRNFINDVESEIIKHANTPNKKGNLKADFFDKYGKPKFGTVIADLKAKANSKIKSANIRLQIQEVETLLEKADVSATEKAKLQKKLARLNKKLAAEGDILDAKLKEAEALLSRYEEYQWLTKTYMDEVVDENKNHIGWKFDPNFKSVPDDVLWDLREGARFATEYPKSWLYRTTKGCNAGKAILPYSDARVGETIQGVAYSDVKDILKGEHNAFLNGDKKAQLDYVTKAIKKQLAQNLIGGMRYQSTSDFRYEYGSDYLITFLEMQAIGAKVQLYTKVIEAVDFLCTMGAEVNMSVMPLEDGYIIHDDGTKQLLFSTVTGINAEAAIAKSKQYDNAQLILVGISDEHIRLALEGDDVNGDVVSFVIPFHGSGNTVKAIQELMGLIGEKLDVTKAQDYSLVQTDHFAKNRTAEQTALWDLRKKIISRSYKKDGKTVAWDGKLTTAEEALLNSDNGSKFLKDLYNRFYVDKNADEYGVSLSTVQAEQIFPYEYWDKSLTYAEADQNGERFKEYCATMGIIPRFSGVDSSGKALGYGNFTNNKGYWKLLIDRKMYNNDGTYHNPGRINVTNFKAETLDPAWGSATYGDVMQKDTDPKKTNAITENVIRQIEAKATDNIMFSPRGDVLSWDIAWDSNNHSSIKEQLKAHLDEVNSMQPVASINYDKANGKPYYEQLDDILRTKFGYKIERQDHGSITFDSKAIAGIRKYVESDAEAAAVIASPYILKRGKPISGHKSHKDKGYPAVVYAAPATLNGQVGNVAVSVLYGAAKRIHSLRVLTPSGNEFVLVNTKNTELQNVGSVTKSAVEPTISPVLSGNRIAQNPNSVNTSEKFSFSERKIVDIPNNKYVEMYHHFGSTKNYDVAGYMLGNGVMLDFSGKHWGDDYSTSRQVDHRDVQEVLDDRGNNGVNAMIDMIGNGNIRLMPEVGGINLAVKPNETQMSQLRGYINHFKGEVVIDIDKVGGDTIHSFSYTRGTSSSKVLSDLKAYFDEGIVPEQKADDETDIHQFLYSDRNKNSVSNRSLLANALESVAQNDVEKSWLTKYKSQIDELNAMQNELSDLRAEIHKIRFTKGQDRSKLTALENKANTLANKISKADKKLLDIEVSKPLKGVLERERAKAYKLAADKGREVARERREGRQKTELRHKIKAFKSKMESRLLNATDNNYVPQGLAEAMITVCELINTDTSMFKKDGSINKAQEQREISKQKLRDLRDEYENLKSSDPLYAGEFDETVYEYLKDLENNLVGRHLSELSLDELQETYDYLRAIEETLMDAKKLIGWGEADNVYDVADSVADEQAKVTADRKNGKRNALKKGYDKMELYALSPMRNVERMSSFNEDSKFYKLFKKLEAGVRKKNKFKMESYKLFEELTTGKNAKAYEDAIYKEVGEFKYTDINGRTFGLSKMQMAQAILSLERENANEMNHIREGGFNFADLDLLRKGKLKEATSEENSHRVPYADHMAQTFADILKNDEWAQKYMAVARQFFNEKAKDAVNETTLAMKHRIVAKDKSYIPFEVDRNFILREISAGNDVQQTINSYGMLQATKDRAPQPIYITGLNNILDRHIDQVATLYGLGVEVRNFNKVWNAKSSNPLGGNPTTRAIFDRNWGADGVKYLEDVVQNIQSPRKSNQPTLYRKVRSNLIGATFLFNLSVVSKQIGSLFASTSMLGYRTPVQMLGNLAYTMANYKKISAEVDQYTATAWMRRQGLSDGELQTLLTEGKRTLFGKLINKMPTAINPTKWIEGMDSAVALSLWKYAKADVAKKNPNLKGEELMQATAEFFDEVVEYTQSMADELHRPEVQKEGGILTDAFGLFKTDLYQMSGQALTAIGRYTNNPTKGNAKAIVATVNSIVMNVAWTTLMTTAFALLRYKVDHYRDDDDEDLTAERWLKKQGWAVGTDIAGYILPLFGSEIVGIIDAIWNGPTEDAVDNLVLDGFNSAYKTLLTAGHKLKEGESLTIKDAENLLTDICSVFGVPASNVLRFFNAMRLHAKDIANGEFLSFEAGVERSPKNLIHKVMEAIEDGDTEKATSLFEDAVTELALREAENGEYGDDEINEAKSKLKTALGSKYKDGDVSVETATEILYSVFGMTENDIYWQLDQWDYAKANGSTEDYNKYDDVFTAMEEGDPSSAIEWHIENKTEAYVEEARREAEENGKGFNEVKARREAKKKAESSLKSAITSHYKKLYKDAYKNGDEEEMKRIRYMLKDTGLYGSTSDLLKTCKDWLKS